MKTYMTIRKDGLMAGYGKYQDGLLAKPDSSHVVKIPNGMYEGKVFIDFFDTQTQAEEYLRECCGSNWTYDFSVEDTQDSSQQKDQRILMDVVQKVTFIKEQFDTILSYAGIHGSFKLNCYKSHNDLTSDTTICVEFSAKINSIPYKPHVFTWDKEVQSVQSFIAEIKAYLFDILDGISNL